jgi:uncharacterized membrane protein
MRQIVVSCSQLRALNSFWLAVTQKFEDKAVLVSWWDAQENTVLKILVLTLTLLCTTTFAEARGGGRVSYGGGHHTYSHGGTYVGGSGSSHRGGHYVNASTGNRYGTHQ